MFLALGEIVGRKLSSHDIIRGLRVDGVGTMIGGTFNSFPHTSFSQNVGLVSVTRVHSRWVCISSGIILILFGMVPKMAVLVASIPQFVLGGAGLVMFGMVLATGIRILSRCNYTTNRYNLYIVAISLGVGMTPTLSSKTPSYTKSVSWQHHPMGMFLALGEIVGRKLSSHDIIRGLRVDGVGTMIGGTFNSFPHTSFSQNVGLVSVTRVHSRWVCISSGIILILFGMVPKMAVLVASIPQFVLGGAGLVMFGMVLATGIRILSRCNYTTNRYNLYIVAISLGVGMTPTLSHDFFSKLPAVLQPLLHSGIMLATLSAVVLNVFFNGYQHHADLVKESVSDKDLKVRTVRMWLLMRKLKKNEHGE
nr:solute carrier family 23 protein [Escherichia coli]